MTVSPTPIRPNLLHAALEHLGRGRPVFPVCSPAMGQHTHGQGRCQNAGKTPLVPWMPYQTALPPAADVRRWWERWPDANIGMATGVLSGVVVLDADGGEARKLVLARGGLDLAPHVWTGKPGGCHFYLRHPGSTISNFARKLPGVDFRGDGGYVLLPPSLHASGTRYRWGEGSADKAPSPIPDWLHELFVARPTAPTDRTGLDVAAVLAGVPEGERDDTIYRFACRLRADGVPWVYAEALVRQAASACRPAFDEHVAVEKLQRAFREFQPNADIRAAEQAVAVEVAAEAEDMPFDETPSAPLPFPIDAFPPVTRAYVDQGARAVAVPPDFVAVPLLGVLGGTIGNTVVLKIKEEWTTPANLNVAVVADTGSGKSPALDVAIRPIQELQRRLAQHHEAVKAEYDQNLAAWEAAQRNGGVRGEKPVAPIYPHVWTVDATVEAVISMLGQSKGLSLVRDEIASVVTSMDMYRGGKGADKQHYLSFWSNTTIKLDRKGQEPVIVRKPCLSIVGGIQPDVLPKLADQSAEDGFVERFLFSYQDPVEPVWNEEGIEEAVKGQFQRTVERLYDLGTVTNQWGEPEPRVVRMSPEAKRLWVAWYTRHQREMRQDLPITLRGTWAKMPMQAGRIALILHCVAAVERDQMPPAELDAETLRHAFDLTRYFKAHARLALREVRQSREQIEEALLRWLREHGPATMTTLINEFGQKNMKADRLRAVLERLEERALVARVTVERAGRGRPAEVWQAVNGREAGRK